MAARADVAAGRRVSRPHYIEESVGRVACLDALHAENDLRAMLVVELEQNLKAFRQLNIDQLSSSQLQQPV